jgi:hypothetical protein
MEPHPSDDPILVQVRQGKSRRPLTRDDRKRVQNLSKYESLTIRKMHSMVEQIERVLLPELQNVASDMRNRHSILGFNVWHGPEGALTDNPVIQSE